MMAAVSGWYAEAQLRLLDGRRQGAESALRTGMRRLEEYRGSLQSTDLRTRNRCACRRPRATGSGHGPRGAQCRAHAAMGRTLSGASFRTPSVRPRKTRLAAALSDLRLLSSELETALVEQGPTVALRRRQRQLEHDVRDLARQAVGRGPPGAACPESRISLTRWATPCSSGFSFMTTSSTPLW